MITYICNHCKKAINPNDKNCVHFVVGFEWRAITSMGKYGDSYDGDLCGECYRKISEMIDFPYYGGGNYELSKSKNKEIDE